MGLTSSPWGATIASIMATFQTKLAAELGERGMGYRTLAKLIDADNVETHRRSIRRWMTGVQQPSRASRNAVTDALGLERGSLDPDDEEDVMAPLMREVLAAAFGNDPDLRARFRAALKETA
jgi:hypothetical protein